MPPDAVEAAPRSPAAAVRAMQPGHARTKQPRSGRLPLCGNSDGQLQLEGGKLALCSGTLPLRRSL